MGTILLIERQVPLFEFLCNTTALSKGIVIIKEGTQC